MSRNVCVSVEEFILLMAHGWRLTAIGEVASGEAFGQLEWILWSLAGMTECCGGAICP